MRRRRLKPDVLVVAAAVLGVAALHVAAAWTSPPLVPLADAPSHEGERVAVEARILDARHGERGTFLLLAADGRRLDALGGPLLAGEPGDEVRLTGIPMRTERGWVLSVDGVTLLAPAASRALTPGDLARAPLDHAGARVAVRGDAKEGILEGDGARLRVTGAPPPRSGWLVATGTFDYDASRAAYALRVESWTSS